jgi:hypothetical protein
MSPRSMSSKREGLCDQLGIGKPLLTTRIVKDRSSTKNLQTRLEADFSRGLRDFARRHYIFNGLK